MKNSILLFTFIFLFVELYAQDFVNPFNGKSGNAIKLKETEAREILLAYYDADSSKVYLAKLTSSGSLVRKVSLSEPRAFVDDIYEFEGQYVIVYSISNSSSQYITHLCFEVYDSALNFISSKKHNITSPQLPMGIISNKYHLDENHNWSAIYEEPNAFTLKIVKYDHTGNPVRIGEKRFPNTSGVGFLRTFAHDGSFNVFMNYDARLYYYSFDSTFNLLKSDSVSSINIIIGSDTLKERFDVRLFGDIKMIDNNFIAIKFASMPDGGHLGLLKMNEIEVVDSRVIPNPNSQIYFDFNYKPRSEISIKNKKMHVYGRYFGSTSTSNMIYAVDTFLQVKHQYEVEFDRGYIYGIQTARDGGCFIFGLTNTDSTDVAIYISKIDSNGIRTFITPIATEFNSITPYPNPGNDHISGIPKQTILTLTDVSGRQNLFNSQANHVDVSALDKGIYFYQIINKQGEVISTGKWVKQ